MGCSGRRGRLGTRGGFGGWRACFDGAVVEKDAWVDDEEMGDVEAEGKGRKGGTGFLWR